MHFSVQHLSKKSLARTGILTTPHGNIQTPVFMPLATSGAVKTLLPNEVSELGAEIILGNTYHLHIRPGDQKIKEFGGLHCWMNWPGPILTDSGGYQAYSLARSGKNLAKITDEGVKFRSHLDGTALFFTPENVLDIQNNLGSDIAMVLDDCAPFPATENRLRMAVERTGDWAKRSIDHWQQSHNLTLKDCPSELSCKGIFGIVQGGVDRELRELSLKSIQDLPFDGIAIGGVSVGEGKANMMKSVDYIANQIDPKRPHYLMGVGEPIDLIRMIHLGMDMFDCVLPTRLARHGTFWTNDFGQFSLSRSSFASDTSALDPTCQCLACRSFNRAYLRHLYMIGESLAGRLLSIHNLTVLFRLVNEIRQSITDDNFAKKYQQYFL